MSTDSNYVRRIGFRLWAWRVTLDDWTYRGTEHSRRRALERFDYYTSIKLERIIK